MKSVYFEGEFIQRTRNALALDTEGPLSTKYLEGYQAILFTFRKDAYRVVLSGFTSSEF